MKVDVLSRTELHRGFLGLEKIRLRYQRFDGQMSPEVDLEIMVRNDSVAVLPYDPRRDMVILIRQFRVGIHLAGEPGWSLEIVAGGCMDQDLPANARRELLEEIGWEAIALQPMLSVYPTPHISKERLHLFLAIIDSEKRSAPGGGLLSENEDIQIVPMPFSQAMERVVAGQFDNPTILLGMHWLARHREALRQQTAYGNDTP
ncbi:MAG: NUDIX domain-containing protein [Magnetococcus sp. XQGC-1]